MTFHEQIEAFFALIRDWNAFASLVSPTALESELEAHAVDALSLLPYVVSSGSPPALFDIGSGGGFPALPLALAAPDVSVTALERSERKVGFLRKVKGALGARNVRVVLATFPQVGPPAGTTAITARALERLDALLPTILAVVPPQGVFLYQGPFSGDWETVAPRFHVEPVEDAWSSAGLRRGKLTLLRRM